MKSLSNFKDRITGCGIFFYALVFMILFSTPISAAADDAGNPDSVQLRYKMASEDELKYDFKIEIEESYDLDKTGKQVYGGAYGYINNCIGFLTNSPANTEAEMEISFKRISSAPNKPSRIGVCLNKRTLKLFSKSNPAGSRNIALDRENANPNSKDKNQIKDNRIRIVEYIDASPLKITPRKDHSMLNGLTIKALELDARTPDYRNSVERSSGSRRAEAMPVREKIVVDVARIFTLKKMLSILFPVLPEKTLKKGETWKQQSPVFPEIFYVTDAESMNWRDSEFTFLGYEDRNDVNCAKIHVKSLNNYIDLKGMNREYSFFSPMESNYEADIYFDAASGKIIAVDFSYDQNSSVSVACGRNSDAADVFLTISGSFELKTGHLETGTE